MTRTESSEQHWLPAWVRKEHPIFELETRRRAENRAVNLLRIGCVPAIFLATLVSFAFIVGAVVLSQGTLFISFRDAEYIVPLVLGWMLVVLTVIQLGAGAIVNILTIAQAAPMISGEIELQSWRLLRTTTLSLHEILMAKFAAAFMQIRGILGGLLVLRVAAVITALVLTAYLFLRDVFYYMSASDWRQIWRETEWLPFLVAVGISIVVYMIQPLIQTFLNIALGMLASAWARSRGQAIAASMVARLGLWVGSILLNVAMMYALGFMIAQWADPNYSVFDAFHGLDRPSESLIVWVIWSGISAYVASILCLEIAVTLGALGLAMRRSRHLGV